MELMNSWNTARYFHAINWWRTDAYGKGQFNEELYRRFVEIRYGLDNLYIKENLTQTKNKFKTKVALNY